MITIKAREYNYIIIRKCLCDYTIYPLFRNNEGIHNMCCISPFHGRSYIVGKRSNRTIISKGNGLSYSRYPLLNTEEVGADSWGLLLEKDAIRDFTLGNEIKNLGLRTNEMEYVLRLDIDVKLSDGNIINPYLLQYSVECPYRISDAPFMSQESINVCAAKWSNPWNYENKHLVAARVLIGNLRKLHDNNILHNAIHEQNYTWALELLDFELSCSPNTPYDREDYQRHVVDLYDREIIQTYQIINYIAAVLHEEINYKQIDLLFAEYGFNLSRFEITIN